MPFPTDEQYRLLHYLLKQNGNKVHCADAAKALGSSRWSINSLTTELRKAGMVTRSGVRDGSNPQLFSLTRKGREIIDICDRFGLNDYRPRVRPNSGRAPGRIRNVLTAYEIATLQALDGSEVALTSGDLQRRVLDGKSNSMRERLEGLVALGFVKSERNPQRFFSTKPFFTITSKGAQLVALIRRHKIAPPLEQFNPVSWRSSQQTYKSLGG